MILRINKSKLREGINIVERIASRSTTLPILRNIIIKAKKNIINISATDLEIGVEWWSLAKVDKEGEVVIPVSIISGFLNYLPEKTVTLSSIDNNLEIECDDFKTQINGFSPDEFPIIPNISEKNSITINSSKLCKSLSQIVDIPSFSTSRPEISGILFNFENKELKIVATDSYRLGEKKIILDEPAKDSFSFILPQKSVKEIINIFGDKEKDIKIVLGVNQVLFESEMSETKKPEINFISRQIEGDYPNYEEIIPTKNKIKSVINRVDFMNQIKAAALFSGKVGDIILKTDPDRGGIEILSESHDLGKYNSFLSGKIEGKKEKITFNYRYLIDGLSKIDSKDILFETDGSGDPALFSPVKGEKFIYIVMPIKA